MKKQFKFRFNNQQGTWSSTEEADRSFIELKFSFGKNVTSIEKNKILLYFIHGLQKKQIAEHYSIVSIDFFKNDEIVIDLENIKLDVDRGLLQLIIEFRKAFLILDPIPMDF